MRNRTFLLFCTVCLALNAIGQTSPAKEFHSKMFKWTIIIPENFEAVAGKDLKNLQGKGIAAIAETHGEELENMAQTIFAFRNDMANYFEANYQPFDPAVDGDHRESCEFVNKLVYETFVDQMPGVEIDSVQTVEKIDGLEFQTFKIKIALPGEMEMNMLMYSRLFGKKEFTVGIVYLDEEKGAQMLDSWKKSTFAK